jgi:hypothetical protein
MRFTKTELRAVFEGLSLLSAGDHEDAGMDEEEWDRLGMNEAIENALSKVNLERSKREKSRDDV